MITQAQWFKHASYQADLQKLLDNPVLQIALDICRDQNLIPLPTTTQADLMEFFAIMGAKRAGYNEFVVNLRALAQPEKPPVPVQKAWEHEKQLKESKPNA
jgi:hypothetical protein